MTFHTDIDIGKYAQEIKIKKLFIKKEQKLQSIADAEQIEVFYCFFKNWIQSSNLDYLGAEQLRVLHKSWPLWASVFIATKWD